MQEYQDSSLWRTAFGETDWHREARGLLRQIYLDLRTRVSDVVAHIPRDIPGLTVHDVTHLDALWEIGSIIAGNDYPLNPARFCTWGCNSTS